MSKTISILTPTRGRPARLSQFIKSVYETATDRNRIEMLMYVDSDDEKKDAYMDYLLFSQKEFADFLRVHIVFGEPKSVSKSWNDLYERSLGDIIIMGNDDLLYRTPGWDRTVEKNTDTFPDDIYCMWMNDGINGEGHCAFPIVSKKWCDTLGYFTPCVYNFGYNDTLIFEVAQLVGRTHWLPHVHGEHMHFSVGKSQQDKTYLENRQGKFQNDKAIHENTKQQRVADAQKLKEVMSES